jgi:hypothetical protein
LAVQTADYSFAADKPQVQTPDLSYKVEICTLVALASNAAYDATVAELVATPVGPAGSAIQRIM